MIIRELTSSEYDAAVPRLAGILVDAVDSGAGVTFMHPLAQDVAEAYWMKQKADVASGQTTLFVADENGVIGGHRHAAKGLAAQPAAPLRSGQAAGAP